MVWDSGCNSCSSLDGKGGVVRGYLAVSLLLRCAKIFKGRKELRN